VNTLERVVDGRSDMRSVRVIHHANQVQYVEPQEHHTLILQRYDQVLYL